MKKNEKGFTLIELLAVIIILAIIALIAVPTITSIIGDSREKAAADSAYGVESAAELWYSQQLLNNGGSVSSQTEFTCTSAGCVSGSGENAPRLAIKGDVPTAGTVTVSTEGAITTSGLVINGYTCTKGSNGKYSCTSGS